MKELHQPIADILNVQYAPVSGVQAENPPRFTWMPSNEENGPYRLEIAEDAAFTQGLLVFEHLPYNFFSHDTCLSDGRYYWRYTQEGGDYAYSTVREFAITESSHKDPVATRENRFAKSNLAHPRLWHNPDSLAQFREKLKADPSHCTFDVFFEKAVKKFIGQPLVAEPDRYPNDVRVMALWRKSYMDCQLALNQVRFLAVAGVILEDETILDQAKRDLLELCRWDVNGSTHRSYHDESSFRVTGAIAWGYDWLHDYLSDEDRGFVKSVLLERTKQITSHVIEHSKVHVNLFDSHAIRSISSVIVPVGIVLLGDEQEAEQWLNYSVDYLNILYTPWGGKDGGWSEGGLYWTTGMAFLIEALNLLKNFGDVNLFQRPFFAKTGDFPLYCFPQDTYRASFCDQSNLGDYPNLKTAFNAREFAGNNKNGMYQWYFDEVSRRDSYDNTDFANTGWWNFYFDDMVFHSNYGDLPSTPPHSGRIVKWFQDIGWVAIHNNMNDPENHISFITKSSPYGCISHSHGDQNAMLLFAYEDPLLIEGGYYVGFNSSMHKDWRRQTKSKNCILIDGVGQYAAQEKAKQLGAKGKVLSVVESTQFVHVKEDATQAYSETVPYLNSYIREIYFVDDAYFVVIDRVSLSQEGEVSYLLQSLYQPTIQENVVEIKGKKAKLQVDFPFVSTGVKDLSFHDQFTGVNPDELVGLDNHYHSTLTTQKGKDHLLISVLNPNKVSEDNKVTWTEQGGSYVFTRGGKSFNLNP